jgi:hypothetical protein
MMGAKQSLNKSRRSRPNDEIVVCEPSADLVIGEEEVARKADANKSQEEEPEYVAAYPRALGKREEERKAGQERQKEAAEAERKKVALAVERKKRSETMKRQQEADVNEGKDWGGRGGKRNGTASGGGQGGKSESVGSQENGEPKDLGRRGGKRNGTASGSAQGLGGQECRSKSAGSQENGEPVRKGQSCRGQEQRLLKQSEPECVQGVGEGVTDAEKAGQEAFANVSPRQHSDRSSSNGAKGGESRDCLRPLLQRQLT